MVLPLGGCMDLVARATFQGTGHRRRGIPEPGRVSVGTGAMARWPARLSPAMDPRTSPDPVEILLVLGGLALWGWVAYVFVT